MAAAAPSSPHSLATASGLLLGTIGAAMAVGALVGWLLGAAGIGFLFGAFVGIPLAIVVVYKVYAQAGRMSTGMFATPRPVPGRLVPALAGSAVILLALPVFAVAGWPLDGWVLAATLWVAGQVFALATDASSAGHG